LGAFHELLRECGYEHLLAHNMMLVFAFIALILLTWIFLAIKDLFGHITKSKWHFLQLRHEKLCNNFALRFFYEFFLEFCIVIFINLSVADFSEVIPSISYAMSILVLICAVGLIIFIITLLCCNGPYVSGYYKKNTALKDTWAIRQVDPNFDISAYIKANI